MKKVTILLFALLITVGASAQFSYGVKAGLNLSSLSETKMTVSNTKTTIPGSSMIAGFFAAAHVNYSFNEILGIQPEVMFSMQGGKVKKSGATMPDDQTLRYNYIQIPVLIDIKPFQGFSILGGPQIGFNTYRSVTTKGKTTSGSDFDKSLKDGGFNFAKIDFSVAVGLQYVFMEHFIASARYNIGVLSTFESRGSASVSGGCNNVLQIGVGYQF